MSVERDSSKSWIQDTEYFKAQCDIGKSFENYVAEKLKSAGVTDVVHEDSGFRKNVFEIEKHTRTSGDLKIKGWPFEVKSRTETFNAPSDWKYPTIFVDTVSSYEKKEIKPRGYIFVSQETGAIIGLSTKTKEFWTIIETKDRKRYIRDKFYSVDIKYLLDEASLVKKLKEMPSNPESSKWKDA